MNDLMVAGVSLSTLIMSVIQACKSFPWFQKHHSPIFAILLGVITAFCYHFFMHQLNGFETISVGMAMGLQATGLYETGNIFNSTSYQVIQPYSPAPEPYNPTPEPNQPNNNPPTTPIVQPVVQPSNDPNEPVTEPTTNDVLPNPTPTNPTQP